MQSLPIDPVLPSAIAALRAQGGLVLVAPPGSGKTTRLPAGLLDSGVSGEVLVLEPRRLAARSAARRVALERGGEVGSEVGYQVRHETVASSRTRLRFLTEGVLVRRVVADPWLEGVAAVILDEFHERHVETDLALAMLREVRETVREDLLLCVMSATLDPEPIARFLGGAPIVRAEGRSFDVAIRHRGRPGPRERLEDHVRAAVVDLLDQTSGHLLVFLPGVEEIRRAARALDDLARRRRFDVLPLHGSLSPAEQDLAIAPSAMRKVVLATNVAESSVTIDGVTGVIDSGLARVLRSDPARGLDVLRVERISRASATQRAGRAGRTAKGVCHRLWSPVDERSMPAFETPELRRTDLAGPALTVRAFASRAPRDFDWFERPDLSALDAADRLLTSLGAVDGTGRVTAVGRRMLELPVHPRLARALVEARRLDCVADAATAIAVLAERDILRRPQPGAPPVPIDLAHRVRLLDDLARGGFDPQRCRAEGVDRGVAHHVDRARRQFARGARPSERPAHETEERVARALLAGFGDRVLRRRTPTADDGILVGGRGARWPSGALNDDSELLLALDLGDREDGAHARWSAVRLAVGVDRSWLSPSAVREEDQLEIDVEQGQVSVLRRTLYHDLVLAERRVGGGDTSTAMTERLAELLRADPWRWLGDQPQLRQLIARIEFIRRVRPDLELPAVDDSMVAAVAAGALGHRRSLRSLADAALAPQLLAVLPPRVGADLERLAPTHVELPSGRRARVEYGAAGEPYLASRIQDFFGLREAPRIGGGRVPLVLHLCAPNQRPVQITADLPSFWATHYPRLRLELRRRYPRHAWPEDPTTAPADGRAHKRRDS